MSNYIDISQISMIGKPPNAISPQLYEKRILDKIKSKQMTNVSFNGFLYSWGGNNTKCEMECSVHGTWECSIGNFISQTKNCPACIGCVKLSRDNINQNVLNIISSTSKSIIYHGIHKYDGKDSLLRLECITHGIWTSTRYNNFKVHNHRCPQCSSYHLNHKVTSSDDLYFYILKSATHIKIGVSSNINRRKREVENTSGYNYELCLYENIGDTNEIEKKIKNKGYHTFFTKEEYGKGYTETVDIRYLDDIKKLIKDYIHE